MRTRCPPYSTLITDHQVDVVHRHANFGANITKRQVLDQGVLRVVFGYSMGFTQYQILNEHGLLLANAPKGQHRLSMKGYKYLKAVYNIADFEKFLDVIDPSPV
jgi:hypothetical protein